MRRRARTRADIPHPRAPRLFPLAGRSNAISTDDRGPFILYFVGLFLAIALLAALLVIASDGFGHRLSLSLLEEAARAERNEIERQKDAYDRWVLKGVLVTQPDDTTCG